ncbi:alanine racemase [bacterium]|nr:alanine racemase [bacterium]
MKSLPLGRPTWVTIDLRALKWNLCQVRRMVGKNVEILAVVKANAYGHGAVACSHALLAAGADALGVATVEEAEELRLSGIKQTMVIFGLVQAHEVKRAVKLNVQPTVVSQKQLRMLNKAAQQLGKKVVVHLKLDTGMGRIGIQPAAAKSFVAGLKKYSHLTLGGMFTHFAQADGRDRKLLGRQMQRLQQAAAEVRKNTKAAFRVHAANSAAVMNTPDSHADMVRPGLMLYGLYPARRFASRVDLKPVLQWKTRIIQLKTVPAGTGLSYGHTFITRRKSRIATLPVGYADGFSRLLSNQGHVLIRGKRCPVVGRVCMDMCLVDVTRLNQAAEGDEVVLIGRQGQVRISADDQADLLDTISYEITCVIGNRVPRIIQGETK